MIHHQPSTGAIPVLALHSNYHIVNIRKHMQGGNLTYLPVLLASNKTCKTLKIPCFMFSTKGKSQLDPALQGEDVN